MAKNSRFKLMQVSISQLQAIKDAADTLSAMSGTGDVVFDKDVTRIVKRIDKFLESNNQKRAYN